MPERQLSDCLISTAEELRTCAGLIGQIEDTVTLLLRTKTPGIGAEMHCALQDIDLLCQRIDNLASYLAAVGIGLPKDIEIDDAHALSRVQLAAMRERLKKNSAQMENSMPPAGHVDLF